MKARNRWIIVLVLLAFAAAAFPIITAEAHDPLPVVGACSLYYRVYSYDPITGLPIRDANGERVYTRYCESTVVIPRMWALGQTNALGELSNQWCALISETRPGVDRASDICFPGQSWRYNTVICYGLVDSDDVWECDRAIGGSQNRMALENLRLVYASHLAQRPPRH